MSVSMNSLIAGISTAVQYSIRLDVVSASTTYIGKAAPGSSEDAAVWQVMLVDTTGGVTSIKFADGSLDFDKVWADRAGLTYS